MHLSVSMSSNRLLLMVQLSYVKWFVTSRTTSLMLIDLCFFFFFMLIVSPNSFLAWLNWLNNFWRSCLVWVGRAASSANSISLIRTVCTLVFALRWAKLNNLPFFLCVSIHLLQLFNNMEKKMLCFTPLNCKEHWSFIITADYTLHVLVKRGDDAQSLVTETDLSWR